MTDQIKQQHVHMFWGFWLVALIYIITGTKLLIAGFCFGLLVECHQVFKKKEKWKLKDRLLDLFFWLVGGCSFAVMVWIFE